MIEFLPGHEYRMCWFLAGDRQDFLALLHRKTDGPWMITHRFRYDSEITPNGKEERNWYTAKGKNGSALEKIRMIGIMDDLCNVLVGHGYIAATGKQWRVELTGDHDDAARQFLALPFCHVREATDEDMEHITRSKPS